jgi:hypothetical protein
MPDLIRHPELIEITGFRLSRLCRNFHNDAQWSFRHSGLDPESSAFPEYYGTGCRIKSGMTGRI